MRHLRRLDRSLGEDLLNNLVLVGGAKDSVQVLLARAGKETLRTLAGVENVEAVDDVDERDRAESTEAQSQYANKSAGLGLERSYRSAGRKCQFFILSLESWRADIGPKRLTTTLPLLGSCIGGKRKPRVSPPRDGSEQAGHTTE